MRIATLLLGVLALGSAAAHAAAPVEGKDYTRIELAQPTTDPKKVVVTEFFSYQCPHCYSFAKPLEAWMRAQPADVLVERVPVSLGRPAWETAARSFLVFNAMQAGTRMDDAIFDAIHRQRLRLDTEQAVTQWAGTQQLDAKQFSALYRSFGIDSQYKSGEAKARALKVPSIPAIVIDNRYLVAIVDSGSFQPQFAVINELIARARREKGAK
jgi:thiol:disulfide interchange protein DsbA